MSSVSRIVSQRGSPGRSGLRISNERVRRAPGTLASTAWACSPKSHLRRAGASGASKKTTSAPGDRSRSDATRLRARAFVDEIVDGLVDIDVLGVGRVFLHEL